MSEEEKEKPALPEDPAENAPEDEKAGVTGEETPAETPEGEEAEEAEFDLEAQIALFREQIVAEPENCINYYNLAEALSELGDIEGAKAEFENALKYDVDGAYGAIIHFGIGNLHFNELMKGTSSSVVKSSVGLLSSHKDKVTITDVVDELYTLPIREFEMAIQDLSRLKADEDILNFVSKNAPMQISSLYYKWASDLIDKSRQLSEYGGEIRDVQKALKLLKKTLDIDPNHSAAHLVVKLAKKMLAEGWQIYDDYGFLAKEIPGLG